MRGDGSSSARPHIPSVIGILAALAALLLLLMRSVGPAETPLDLSLPWGAREFPVLNAARYADAVRAATDGRVTIRLHPGAALGIKGPESLRAIRDGVAPMIEMGGFQQIGLEPLFGLEALPFLVRDRAELALLYKELRPAIEAKLDDHGLILLYQVPWPPQNIFARKPLAASGDFSGLVIRTLDANTTDLARLLGMAPVQLASADVVPALATHRIDAVMTSTTTAAAQHYAEFLSHALRSNHGWLSNFLVIRKDAFAALSPEDQATMIGIARRLEPDFHDVSTIDDRDKLQRLIDEGMTVLTPAPALRAELEARARPLWRAFAKRLPESRPLLDRYLAATGRPPLGEE